MFDKLLKKKPNSQPRYFKISVDAFRVSAHGM